MDGGGRGFVLRGRRGNQSAAGRAGRGGGECCGDGHSHRGEIRGKGDARAVRKSLGLRDDLPVLLVLSGGFGMGPVGKF